MQQVLTQGKIKRDYIQNSSHSHFFFVLDCPESNNKFQKGKPGLIEQKV